LKSSITDQRWVRSERGGEMKGGGGIGVKGSKILVWKLYGCKSYSFHELLNIYSNFHHDKKFFIHAG